ncbi:MAG: hypothetical protein R6U32_02235 [Candidatus Woesearchaeota archaeon]
MAKKRKSSARKKNGSAEKSDKKKAADKRRWTDRELRITLIIITLILIITGITLYMRSSRDADRLNDALETMRAGSLESGLEKCSSINSDRGEDFCQFTYLNLKITRLKKQAAAEHGENLTEEQQQNLDREIQKEYAFVCGMDRHNPYLQGMCGSKD